MVQKRCFGCNSRHYNNGPGGISGRTRRDITPGNVGTERNSGNQGSDVNSGAFDEDITTVAETVAEVSVSVGTGMRGANVANNAVRAYRAARSMRDGGRQQQARDLVEATHTSQGSSSGTPNTPSQGPTGGNANMNAGQSAMQAAQRVLEQTVRTMDDIAEIRDMLDSDPTA